MKTALMILCLFPLFGLGQQMTSLPQLNKDKNVSPIPTTPQISRDIVPNSPVVVAKVKSNKTTNLPNRAGYTPVELGTTIYDMQTNASMARRLIVYPDGQKTGVWTQGSNVTQTGFPDRGTGYNHFINGSWGSEPTGRIETSRSGWPNIGHVKKNGKDVEYVISHYAPPDPTQASGGIYLLFNDSIGSSNWSQQFLDQGTGPIWYKTAESGDYIYVIGTYSDTTLRINNMQTPTVFSKYQISTNQWVVKNQFLPQYDTSIYKFGSGDTYSIDAKDSFVSIVIGPESRKVIMWKSQDSAKTFKRTILDSLNIPTPKQPGDTSWFDYSDGSINVILDKDGYSKVFWSKYVGFKYYGNDTQWYNRLKHGIVYYNEKTGKKMTIPTAKVWDRNGNDTVDIGDGWQWSNPSEASGLSSESYGGCNFLLTFPNATIDTAGNIFVIYSAIVELAYYSQGTDANGNPIYENLHDIYVVYSKDDGKTWAPFQNISNSAGNADPNSAMENVFGAVAKYCGDGMLHLVWQQDDNPGTYVGDNDPQGVNSILYVEVPLSDILSNKLGKGDTLVNSIYTPTNPLFTVSNLYPNPASTETYIGLNLMSSADVNVKLLNVLGQEVNQYNFSRLNQGSQYLHIDCSNITPGIYMVKINAGNYSETQKLIIK